MSEPGKINPRRLHRDTTASRDGAGIGRDSSRSLLRRGYLLSLSNNLTPNPSPSAPHAFRERGNRCRRYPQPCVSLAGGVRRHGGGRGSPAFVPPVRGDGRRGGGGGGGGAGGGGEGTGRGGGELAAESFSLPLSFVWLRRC